jgi:hypothetical protein
MTEHPQLNVRVDEEFLKRLDNWRRRQSDLPNRPEAVRRLVEIAFKSAGSASAGHRKPAADYPSTRRKRS